MFIVYLLSEIINLNPRDQNRCLVKIESGHSYHFDYSLALELADRFPGITIFCTRGDISSVTLDGSFDGR